MLSLLRNKFSSSQFK